MSEEELNSYRLTSMDEPSDEMLERIMSDAAADARQRGEEANRKFFDKLREDGEKIKKSDNYDLRT